MSYGLQMIRPDVQRSFEAYGRLMAKIGGLEQFMRIALGEHLTRRMTTSGRTDRADLERHAIKIMKMDFGKLLHQVYTKFKFSKDVLQIFKDAKSFRDHLAHDFWVCNLSNLRSERGTRIIIEHCELLERQFEKVADLLIAVTGLDATMYVNFVSERSEDEESFKGWEVRLEAARAVEAFIAKSLPTPEKSKRS